MGELVALESVAREHMGGAPGTGKWASETQPPREGAASGASGFDSSDAAPSSRDASTEPVAAKARRQSDAAAADALRGGGTAAAPPPGRTAAAAPPTPPKLDLAVDRLGGWVSPKLDQEVRPDRRLGIAQARRGPRRAAAAARRAHLRRATDPRRDVIFGDHVRAVRLQADGRGGGGGAVACVPPAPRNTLMTGDFKSPALTIARQATQNAIAAAVAGLATGSGAPR